MKKIVVTTILTVYSVMCFGQQLKIVGNPEMPIQEPLVENRDDSFRWVFYDETSFYDFMSEFTENEMLDLSEVLTNFGKARVTITAYSNGRKGSADDLMRETKRRAKYLYDQLNVNGVEGYRMKFDLKSSLPANATDEEKMRCAMVTIEESKPAATK